MLGSDRFSFETPNVIDPGDLPPSQPNHRVVVVNGARSPSPPQPAARRASSNNHNNNNNSNNSSNVPSDSPAGTTSTKSSSSRSSSSDEEEGIVDVVEVDRLLYWQARNSPSRLLRDIGDLDLPPPQNHHHDTSTTASSGNSSIQPQPYDPYHDEEDHDDHGGATNEHSLPSVEEARLYAASLLHTDADMNTRPSTAGNLSKYAKNKHKHVARSASAQASNFFGRTMVIPMLLSPDETTKASKAETGRMLAAATSNHSYNDEDAMGLGSSKHLVRRRLFRCSQNLALKIGIGATALLFIILVSFGIAKHMNNGGNSSSTNVPSTPNDPSSGQPSTTPGPSSSRFQAMVDYLVGAGISGYGDLVNSSTPQYNAALFMADQDLLAYHIPPTSNSTSAGTDVSEERFLQRYAITVLYYALNGTSWDDSLNFLSMDECSWFHDRAIAGFWSPSYSLGVTCNTNLQITSLFLPDGNWLPSTNNTNSTNTTNDSSFFNETTENFYLPSELRLLSNLEMVSMENQNIGGSIENAAFQSMPELRYLNLAYNHLTGPVPNWIGNLEQLEVLALSNNQLAGRIPANMGTLGQLKTIALDDNLLTGSIDVCNQWINAEYLYLDRNELTGFVDSQFLIDLDRLRELDISANHLNGTEFPYQFLEHKTLHVLDLANNHIQGSFPDTISDNYVLRYLSLHANALNGSIPSTITNLHKLTHLDVQSNHITGLLPNSLGAMTAMNYLFVGDNDLTPTRELPPFLSQMTELRELSMNKIQMYAQIPIWLATDLTQLQLIDFSNNHMSGSIPQNLWNLPNLEYLFLDHNRLTGHIPDTINGSMNLKVLTLHKNPYLNGTVDQVCTDAPDLVLLTRDCHPYVTCESAAACCQDCCAINDPNCYVTDLSRFMTSSEGMWEFNYTRESLGLDPDVLDETGLFKVIHEDP